MRKVIEVQMKLREVDISTIQFDLQSRDKILNSYGLLANPGFGNPLSSLQFRLG